MTEIIIDAYDRWPRNDDVEIVPIASIGIPPPLLSQLADVSYVT